MALAADSTASEPVFTIQGRTVRLPVEVRDASSAFATFVVPAARVRSLIGDDRVRPVEPFPGRALCSIAAIEYRDNDLGRYNEIAVAFLVRKAGCAGRPLLDLLRGRVGAYIHRLPVTTALSCEAGRKIWGFPKVVADIQMSEHGGRQIGILNVDGEHVLTLSVVRRGRLRFQNAPLDSYAVRDRVLLRTPFVASAERVGLRLGGATITLGRHPVALELRSLGLPKRPLLSGWIGSMRARFGAAETLGERAV
jgi:hypothetical protein